ncbi:hypothetical protein ACIGCM_00810 [Pseudomonas sp. NPDC078700]|uniref:hypothetical protein n=1 Tax=Pseudomonas sp. NPDC078700 TaxID=3364424 RepID=UPI0037C6A996
MNNLTRYLTAVAFSFAGVASHAQAEAKATACGSSTCFQLTPLAKDVGNNVLAEDGSSLTPQGRMVAENGYSRTPQEHLRESKTV